MPLGPPGTSPVNADWLGRLDSMDAVKMDDPPTQRYLDSGRGRLRLRVEPALLDRRVRRLVKVAPIWQRY